MQPWVGLLTWNMDKVIGWWFPMEKGVSEKFEFPAVKTKDAKKKAKKA